MEDGPGHQELQAGRHFVKTEVTVGYLEFAAEPVMCPLSDALNEPYTSIVRRRAMRFCRRNFSHLEQEVALLVFDAATTVAGVVPSG